MAEKKHYSDQKNRDIQKGKEITPAYESTERVLMPREYYDMKHPLFGSQIHYTIDVFRQVIRDARARKQRLSKQADEQSG